jgi:hypothetical protein
MTLGSIILKNAKWAMIFWTPRRCVILAHYLAKHYTVINAIYCFLHFQSQFGCTQNINATNPHNVQN